MSGLITEMLERREKERLEATMATKGAALPRGDGESDVRLEATMATKGAALPRGDGESDVRRKCAQCGAAMPKRKGRAPKECDKCNPGAAHKRAIKAAWEAKKAGKPAPVTRLPKPETIPLPARKPGRRPGLAKRAEAAGGGLLAMLRAELEKTTARAQALNDAIEALEGVE